jgi:hypothetical protein
MLDEVLDDGALRRLSDGRAVPHHHPHAAPSIVDDDDRRGDVDRILVARVAVPYASFASFASAEDYDDVDGGGYGGRAVSTRDAVALASLVREEYHLSEYDIVDGPPPDADACDDDPRRRGGRRRRDVIVDRWLFNVAIPVAGCDGGNVSDGGNNGLAIASRASYRDPIYSGTLEDGAPSRPNTAEEEEDEGGKDAEELEVVAVVDPSNENINSRNSHSTLVVTEDEDRRRIVQSCLFGLFGGIAVVLAIIWMTYKGDEDDDDTKDFMTPSPYDARVVGVDEDLPRYSFEEHGMSGRRLFFDCDGSPSSSSSSTSQDAHHLVHYETTDNANEMSFGGQLAMDEQIESRSELPRDCVDDETSSSVHEEPCERKATSRPHSSSKDFIVPSSDKDEKYERSCRSNNGIFALPEGSKTIAENPIATNCVPEIFSPRYSQGPDSPAWCDDIATLPNSNALSTSDETTKCLNDVGNEANEGHGTRVNTTETCRSDSQADTTIGGLTSPPKIGRMVLKELLTPSFPRFEPVAIDAPDICQLFSKSKKHVEQEQKFQQPSPIDSSNPSVSSSAMTAKVNNACNAKRNRQLATGFEGRDDDLSSHLSTSISPGHKRGTNERQESIQVTHARVSTSPISREQWSSDESPTKQYDDFEESAQARHAENANHLSPAHPFRQHRDPYEVSLGPCGNDLSDGNDSISPTRVLPSARSLGSQRALFKHQDDFSSPASTVAATVQEFTAPRKKMQMTHDGGDRPFPISSGGAGQSKRFGMSFAHVSSSNDGPGHPTSECAHQEVGRRFEHVSHPSNSHLSEDRYDLPRKKSRSKEKKRQIKKKLISTSTMPAVHKPLSALIPLSQRVEKPAWQFSHDQVSEQSY